MKQYHVYELFDQEGTIVYVGVSVDVKRRFIQHTKWQPNPGQGYFHGRTDLHWRIIQSFRIKKEALALEGFRKLELGMHWTEKDGGKIVGNRIVQNGKLEKNRQKSFEIVTCEHCGKSINRLNYGVHHGPKCKTIRESDQTENQSLQDPSYLDPYHL